MTGYIKRIEKSLSAEKIDILKHIFKPTVVKTPLEDSRKDICILKDGEIRSYGSIYKLRHDKSKERKAYLTSPFSFSVDVKDTNSEFVKISAYFDVENGECHVYINDEHLSDIKMTNPCPTGISYLILQCDTDGESDGFYIKSLSKTGAKL